jgi:hypothetical protein
MCAIVAGGFLPERKAIAAELGGLLEAMDANFSLRAREGPVHIVPIEMQYRVLLYSSMHVLIVHYV